MPSPLRAARASLAAALLAAAPLGAPAAQSLYAIDDLGNAVQFTGPPSGPCSYPGGPLLGLFGYASTGFCPTPKVVPPAPSALGDVAVDKSTGNVWVTDGLAFAELQPFGTPINGFKLAPGQVLPGAVTGLGFDFATFGLWITDGTFAAEVSPPLASQCQMAPPIGVLVPAFPLPLAPGATATDIDFDAGSGTLWICDDTGLVTNALVGGGLGPAGGFSAVATAPCALAPSLQGLAVDDAAPAGALYVPDGALVVRFASDGSGAAPPTFYSPVPCSAPPTTGAVRGLDFSAPAIGFGKPSGSPNPLFPVLGASAQSTVPSPAFGVQIAGAKKGALVTLFASLGALCPPVGFGPIQVHIAPASVFQLATGVVSNNGLASFPLPIPPTVAVGGAVFLQALTFDPASGGFEATGALALTFARR